MCQGNLEIIFTIFGEGLDVCHGGLVDPPAHLSQLTKEAGEVKV